MENIRPANDPRKETKIQCTLSGVPAHQKTQHAPFIPLRISLSDVEEGEVILAVGKHESTRSVDWLSLVHKYHRTRDKACIEARTSRYSESFSPHVTFLTLTDESLLW